MAKNQFLETLILPKNLYIHNPPMTMDHVTANSGSPTNLLFMHYLVRYCLQLKTICLPEHNECVSTTVVTSTRWFRLCRNAEINYYNDNFYDRSNEKMIYIVSNFSLTVWLLLITTETVMIIFVLRIRCPTRNIPTTMHTD